MVLVNAIINQAGGVNPANPGIYTIPGLNGTNFSKTN